jgi:O-antigen/teichoic acid export membrane protein
MCVGVLATVPSRVAGSVVFGQGRPRVGLIVTLSSIALLFALFGPLVLLLGLAGGGLAYAIAGVAALYLQSWAVRSVARFPWASLLRIYLLSALAGVASWVVAAHIHGIVGLTLSGLVFGLADLGLLWLFARPELTRSVVLIGIDRNPFVRRTLGYAQRRRQRRPTVNHPGDGTTKTDE